MRAVIHRRVVTVVAVCTVMMCGPTFTAWAYPVNLTGGGNHNEAMTPSVSVAGSHRWVAWVEYAYNPSNGSENVKLRAVRYLDQAHQEGPLDVATGRIMNPVVLALANGDAWFFWIQVETGGSRLKARRRAGGAWQATMNVCPDRAGFPAAHLDGNGNPWVAWEAYDGDDVEIRIAHWTGSAFSSSTGLSQNGVNAYAPAIELDAEDALWIAWHAYVDHNYDVFTRRRVSGSWGPTWQVTDSTGYHVNPTMHKGCCGVVWIGWVAKGMEARVPGTPLSLYGWVIHRRLQLRRLQPDGTRDPVHQVPVPFEAMKHSSNRSRHSGPEAFQLANARGKIGVFYRLVTNRGWKFHWRVFMQYMNVHNGLWLANPFDVTAGGDSKGYAQRPAAAQTEDGFLVAWQRDNRDVYFYPAGFSEPESDVFLNEIMDTDLPSATVSGQALYTYDSTLRYDQPRPRVTLRHLGSDYQLMQGDLHAHTEYSYCTQPGDDLIQENYRLARDVAALDFYTVTDHDHQMSHHDWFVHRALCDLNHGASGLTVLLGYEYTSGIHGHQNVIHAGCQGGNFTNKSYTTPEQLFGQLPAGQALAIPHHPAHEPEWSWWNMRRFNGGFNRLYEIHQVRGSFECYWCKGVFRNPYAPGYGGSFLSIPADVEGEGRGYFQDALAMGHRMGVIASPDHGGMWGVAAAYATSRSQGDLFAALWERRTFGVSNAVARLALDFRADGHLMGEEYQLHGDDPINACPVFYGRVRTDYVHPNTGQPGVIEEIKIFRVDVGAEIPSENGEIFRITPGTGERTFTFHDAGCPLTGSSAYYLRAIQSDVYGVDTPHRPSIGWTSPVFVDWTPGSLSRNASIVHDTLPASMNVSETQTAMVRVQNTGDIDWTGKEGYFLSVVPGGLSCEPVHLGSDEYVLAGQNHDFQIEIDSPASPGTYTVVFQMECPAGKFGQTFSAEVVVGEVVCIDGETRPCGTDVGACEFGLETCAADEWGPCTGGVGPQAESCNGLDDDCDGTVPADEADVDADDYRICEGDCLDDNADVNPGQSEVGANCTDGIDNDCDGDTDAADPPCSVECTSNEQCSDGNVCNGTETCDTDQACQPGTPLDCDDGNPCTDDACDPIAGCGSVHNTLPCDDGDACTMGDTCQAGECSGVPLDSDGDGYIADSCEGTDCDDTDAQIHPGIYESGASCQDGSDNDCDGLVDGADPGCMSCSADADCRDANLCNGEESCSAGACQPGTPLDCDDGDPCTDDRCVPAEGCEHTPDTSEECVDDEPEVPINGSCGCTASGTAGPGLAILGLLALMLCRRKNVRAKKVACLCAIAVCGLAFTALAAPVNLTGGGNHNTAVSPSVSVEGSHRWIAWVEYAYNPNNGAENVKLRAVRYLDQTLQEGALDVATGRIMNPVVLTCANGDAWFFWIRVDSSGGRLESRRRIGGDWQSAPFEVSSIRAGFPAAHLDANGQPWVAFEAYDGDDVEIRISHWTGSAFSHPATISEPGVPSYNPALEVDTLGGIWAVWQAWVDHNYDIFARRRVAGAWGSIWPITDAYGGGSFLGMHVLPTLAHGASGVAWIGWVTKGMEDKWFSGSGTKAHLPSHVRNRQIQIRRVHPNGDCDPIHPVPVPIGSLVDPDVPMEHRGADRPLVQTASGKVMVFYALLDKEEPDGGSQGAPWPGWRWPVFWRARMQFFNVSNNLWLAQPIDLVQGLAPSGGYPGPAAVGRTASGVLVAWQQDTRREYYPDGFDEPTSDIWINELANTALGSATTPDAALQSYIQPLVMDQPRSNTILHHLDDSYQLLFGDLHSHTLHSLCNIMKDDHIEEDYRRGRDLVNLDFYAVTDHGSHISRHDWYRHRMQCHLNNGVGGMTTLAGLEVTQHTDDGHQNVIYDGCEGDLLSVASQPRAGDLWDSLPPDRALTIPHNSGTRDFRLHDQSFKRLFEIYQWRGSIECYDCLGVLSFNHKPVNASTGFGYFQNALAIGQRLGVIASPDHPGFFGVAAAYANSRSQLDIFDALFNRRTFGVSNAAARLRLDFRGDGRLMGEEYVLRGGDCPVFYGRATTEYVHPVSGAPAVIEQIKIYRVDVGSFEQVPGEDGQVFLLQPNTPEVSFTFHDAGCPGTGSSAYYLRAVQSDVHGVDTPNRPSIAWTSPVFIDWIPGAPSRNAAMVSHTILGSMSPSGTQTAMVRVQNSGDIPWTGKEGYFLSVTPGGLSCDPEHLGADEYVLPGQNHDFPVVIDAPASSGSHILVFQMDSPADKFGQMLSVEVTVEEVVCADGDTRPCGTDVGACEFGLETCTAGDWGPCTGSVGPQAESCNGLDDDCDGTVPADEADVDADGYRICEGDCLDDNADVNPGQSEVGANCTDGIDNDCDGDTDAADPPCSMECTSNEQCSDGNVCNGTESCDADQTCQPGTPLDCDDGNPCTDDRCVPAKGCEHTPDTSEECADEEPKIPIDGSCGCATSGTAGPGLAILGLLALMLRRRCSGRQEEKQQ